MICILSSKGREAVACTIKKVESVFCPSMGQNVDMLVYYTQFEIQDRQYNEVLAFSCPHAVERKCGQECMKDR